MRSQTTIFIRASGAAEAGSGAAELGRAATRSRRHAPPTLHVGARRGRGRAPPRGEARRGEDVVTRIGWVPSPRVVSGSASRQAVGPAAQRQREGFKPDRARRTCSNDVDTMAMARRPVSLGPGTESVCLALGLLHRRFAFQRAFRISANYQLFQWYSIYILVLFSSFLMCMSPALLSSFFTYFV
jgi:hypothetical protein